ncbi:hypothetical protein AK812_SmicGene27304 [Symbiodinium microadriaticum]|uniref:Domain of unknown function at the cortex 1 domain-containing protein n=1 Tax=Symbiodinium microadriaticum TaxID=2951 RepID=A0A1Q9D7D5_SYMMI|nr:hypothetical protein AK812_SmicGene27304 [Symbiodinium microadriaticum]
MAAALLSAGIRRPLCQLRRPIQASQRCFFGESFGGSSSSTSWPTVALVGGAAAAAVAAVSWWAWVKPGKTIEIDIKPITDEVFDENDNLFVFYVDKADDLTERRGDIQRVVRALIDEAALKKLKYYQNVRKEGDPPLPKVGEEEPKEAGAAPLRIVMYKGQRKSILHIGDEIPKQEVLDFFKPVSQDLGKLKVPKSVPLVSNESFRKDVLEDSQPGNPMVLLQMYEDTCFLCFLMRPFINSLGELLLEDKAPFRLKRLNIEKNDFPDGCPVARGTPTFALFRGKDTVGEKWEEFKPKDLCEKIAKVFPLSDSAFQKMDDLQAMVPRRFQLFTQLVMWSVELQKLESCIASAVGESHSDASSSEDTEFNSVLSRLMARDMRRIDGLPDSVNFLQHQVDEVEHDALVMSIMLGERVMAREKEEEVLLVDVILSVVNNEMRSVRSEFDKKLNAAVLSNIDVRDQEKLLALSGDGLAAKDTQEIEDKLKRLQDSQQQSMLKIAGLRSAHKHAEGQANFAVERLKRLQTEVSNIVDQVVYQQSRLDYLLVHGAALNQGADSGSFQAIVSAGADKDKKPKLKAGATLPSRQMERTGQQDTSGGGDPGHMPDSSDEVNSSRIARLGKKLLELDGQVNRGMAEVKADIESVNQTLLSFLELLPRRLRRMLQKQLFPDPEEEVEIVKTERPHESKKHVNFSDHVETRTYHVEDDSRLPWQLVGEADIKWSWCYKPRDEMGRDLAMCLQQFDSDREEFETKVVQWLQGGGVGVGSLPVRSSMAVSSFRDSLSLDGLMSMSMGMGGLEEGVAAPQLMHFEERLERLGTELFNIKRVQDVDHVRKVDKEDLQLVVSRLGAIEKLNIPDLKIRIEALEGDTKFSAQNVTELREKVFKVESVAAPRSELTKVQNGFEQLMSDHQAMKVELKEASASMYNSNRKFIHELQEVKTTTQNSITVLHKQKVEIPDLAAVTDKVVKLEQSIKDNRRILGDGGGQEINAVVRRIILNLEDKIMVLEKKIDALADGRPQKDMMPRNESPAHKHTGSFQSSEMQEAALHSVSEELTAMTDAVAKLKQDISVSKVHIDEMAEQYWDVTQSAQPCASSDDAFHYRKVGAVMLSPNMSTPQGGRSGDKPSQARHMRNSFLQRLEAMSLSSSPFLDDGHRSSLRDVVDTDSDGREASEGDTTQHMSRFSAVPRQPLVANATESPRDSGLPGECQAIAMEVLGASPSQGSSNFLSTDDATRVGWASFNSVSAGLAGLALAGPVGSALGISSWVLSDSDAAASGIVAATGVAICFAGGHVLLAAAGATGVCLNLVQNAITSQEAPAEEEGALERGAREILREEQELEAAEAAEAEEEKKIQSKQASSCWAGMFSCWSCTGCFPAATDREAGLEGEPLQSLDIAKRRLILESRRHLRQEVNSGLSPLILYEATSFTERRKMEACQRASLVPARPIPINARGTSVVNNNFVGKLVMMHRQANGAPSVPSAYDDYFAKKTRRWELRLQGRFVRKPTGKLFGGVVLRDFDYNTPLSRFSAWLSTLSISPLEYTIGTKVVLTFGDRGKASLKEDAMLSHVVAGLQAFDQIIVTEAADELPAIDGNLDGLGIRRHVASSSSSWAAAAEDVECNINPDRTYTFCFWSAARFIDLIGGALTDLVPLIPASLPFRTFLDHWPPHFVFYELESDSDGAFKHIERKKSYLLDLMVLNPRLPQNQNLARKYYFATA